MNWLLAHFIGDYIFQTDWMAANKKTNSLACLAHTLAYILPFVPLLWGHLTLLQLVLIAVQHFAQDRTQFVMWFMKLKGSEGFSKPPMAPWSIILTDNILHVCWIAAVLAVI